MGILPAKAVPKMTYTVSGGTLNPTHSIYQLILNCLNFPTLTGNQTWRLLIYCY